MRIVIDKDFNQRALLQESYEKAKPTYKVCATNSDDRFIYATNLKNINEAVDATYDLAFDPIFDDCKYEICECLNGKEREVWTSDGGILIKEGEEGGFWSKLGNAAKKTLDGLKKGINVVGAMTKQFSKDMLKKWREAGYFNKQGYITGLGYKVMTGQVKNTIPVDTGSDKTQDISKVWDSAKSNVIQGLKKQGITPIGEITAIVKNDKDAILLTAKVQTKDGDEETLTFDQDGQTVDGNGAAVDPTKGGGNTGGNVGGNTGSGNTGGNVGGGMTNDEKKGVQSIVKRVDAIEKALKNNDIMEESWSFNGVKTTKEGLERSAISTFFKQLNESDVKEIVFIEGKNKKVYDINNGSSSYSQFKKDVRESTCNARKMFKESNDKTTKTYNMVVEFSKKSKLNGYKMSDFGGIDTPQRVVTFNAVKENTSPKPTKKIEKESNFKDGDKVNVDNVVPKKTITESTLVNESLVLEMDVVNPEDQIKALVASMNKFTSGKPETSPLTKPTANVSTTSVSTFGMPEHEVVAEAEGDEEGADEADPFATDDAGGDEGGGDGGESDPFATDDTGDGEGGGDDAGGDGDGGEADPFADGGGDGGGDVGGDATGGDNAGGGDDASTKDKDEPTGEPAPEPAINTDAQGNQKSQYNINVTKAFNVDDTFELNEDEQKEFFGKIDQLVKIPDMENYALYLYQITPDNVNLDDVHYINALYELSVKLGLLEDVYADSNLLDKYSSYKYSVVKNGEDGDNGKGGMTIQEDRKYVLMEGTDKPKVQKDNEEKNKKSKKVGSSKDDDERRGPKDMKLNKDKNGADKPVIIDTRKDGWTFSGKDEDKKLTDSTDVGAFHGLGWIATFKAMQFGSPRYLSMYIKRNGDGKPEEQCRKYLEKLSYTEIEFVNIEEVDPYEYVYRMGQGMKTPETVRTDKFANEEVPVTYIESTDKKVNVGDFIDTPADTFGGNGWNTVLAQVVDVDGDKFLAKAVDSTGRKSWQLEVVGKTKEMRGNSTYGKTTEAEFRELKNRELARESAETKVPESIPGDIKRDVKRVITKLNAEIRGTKQFNFMKECGVEKPQLDHLEFLTHYKTAHVNETLSETTYKFVLKKNDSMMSRMFFSNMKEKLFMYLGTFATKYNMECNCQACPTYIMIDFVRNDLNNPMGYDMDTMINTDEEHAI